MSNSQNILNLEQNLVNGIYQDFQYKSSMQGLQHTFSTFGTKVDENGNQIRCIKTLKHQWESPQLNQESRHTFSPFFLLHSWTSNEAIYTQKKSSSYSLPLAYPKKRPWPTPLATPFFSLPFPPLVNFLFFFHSPRSQPLFFFSIGLYSQTKPAFTWPRGEREQGGKAITWMPACIGRERNLLGDWCSSCL